MKGTIFGLVAGLVFATLVGVALADEADAPVDASVHLDHVQSNQFHVVAPSTQTVECPEGTVAVSGGYTYSTIGGPAVVTWSVPSADLAGWTARFEGTSGTPEVIGRVHAVCAG